MKETRRSFLTSCTALILCFAMLLGTTFAWFTDMVTSSGNKIVSGTLDLDLQLKDKETGNYSSINESSDPVFDYDKWEPGYTDTKILKVENVGSLSFKWVGNFVSREAISELAKVIEVYIKTSDTDISYPAGRDEITLANGWKNVGTLDEIIDSASRPVSGELLRGEADYFAITLKMQESAGNEYQDMSLGAFDIAVHAAQFTSEQDSFDSNYDENSQWPTDVIIGGITASANVTTDADGKLSSAVSLNSADNRVGASLPAGVQLENGTSKVTVSVSQKAQADANVTLSDNEKMLPVDVHIDGVAAGNTLPIEVFLGEWLPVGLNMGNYKLYHVENGATNEMSLLADGETPTHNSFKYDPATGDVTLYMASFSEVAMVADTVSGWEGGVDHSWYVGKTSPYFIANADQLWSLSQIVGGMAEGIAQDSFKGKNITLLSDINLGDDEKNNVEGKIFYPIGYNSSDGKYEKTGVAVTTGFYNFCGTFDGNGNTISNFYQNTWEMKGDNNYYDATLQYYRDGMGLFGRVYGGTIKNLTVSNFSSDGEYTTTGAIAAYADGATFENIAIFKCNPRVYNIGNGGIVGCVGWYAKEANLKTTFKNITVDNTNKISALWGSYDVACGGIVGQYYPTSGQTSANKPANGGVHFENCHVSAQMDVYNDVCANYQYYAYRYTGMLIGSVRENVTIDGKSYPKMDGITAENCTVHFGTWNDYYYCEIIDNTTASYTHDYQMSRLTEIKAIDGTTITYLDGTTGTVPATGRANYVIVDYTKGHGTENATCYHFKDGKVWNHSDAGTEIVDGKEVLVEDKQHIYLEFNNLVTGYGWGVTTKGVGDLAGVTILDREEGNSVQKFEGKVETLTNNRVYTLDEIFNFVDNGVELVPGALTVTVTNVDENNPVSEKISYDRENWGNGTITLSGTGEIKITIQDYYFCTPTTITVNVTERQPEEKFDIVMNNGNFLHRVGNSGTVALDKLFKAKSGVSVGTISISVETVDGTGASGSYYNNAMQFNGTGVVKVTIKDDDKYCTPTVLYLEVVEAVNYSGKQGESLNATSNNVVLLTNIGSGFTVSDGYAFYGNGFTLSYTGDGRYLNNGLKQGVVMVQNGGILDNLHIKASIYPTAFMYYGTTQMGDYVQDTNTPKEVDGDKTRYYYQLSAVATYGDATISNCYIYGGRTNIYVNTGNVTIKDSVLECGTVANVQIQSTNEYTVTLDNVTTIQYRTNATIGDTSKVMLGVGVLVGPETASNPTIVLEGNFKQYNWVTAEDKAAVSSSVAQMIIQGALDATAYNHTINGKTASNLGIIFMNEEKIDIEDNTGLPYKAGTVTMKYGNSASAKGQVYSLQGATGSQIYSDYVNADRTTVNGDYIPRFDFDLGNQELSYDGSEDTRYLYGDKNGVTALYQDGNAALTLDLTKLATIYKYDGINYTVTAVCKDANGNALTATNGVVTLSAQGSYTLEFTVNDNIFYNKSGETITKGVARTYTVPLTLTVKEANIKNAVVNITKTALDGVYTTVNLTDYKLRINFLDAISVTDYDNKGSGTTVSLSSNIASATLTPASVNVFTTAFTITVTYNDGRVLTVNFSKISGSSPGTKTAVVNTSGGLYFITEGALNNKPTASSSQNKCTITSVSFKGNSGSTVTNDTDATVTWALGSSSGCFAEGTLVRLADGTQKPIEEITFEDQLLAWDFNTGAYAVTVPSLIDRYELSEKNVINLKFSDGTVVRMVVDHGFFDVAENKFVFLNEENVANYVGHTFVKASDDGAYENVELVGYEITVENVAYYSIQTAFYNNCIVEGMFTLTAPPEMLGYYGWFDYFEIGEDMKYDEEKMEADIEKYGLYTYEDFAEYVTYEQFIAFNGPYLKVLVGRGVVTYEQIIDLISMYVPQGN